MSELACENLSYGGVLHEVSLALRPGKVTALLGPSGAGKSTLLWLLAGLWEPTAGNVTRDDGTLGMVFQQPGLWEHMSAEQHLKAVGADKTAVDSALARMGLTELRQRKPASMSGGERQRLSIARALVIEPDWLLLDEPMAHLDGQARQALFDSLRQALRESRAGVLLATHHAEEALRLADEVVVLVNGRVVQQGSAEDVYRQPQSPAAAQVTGQVSSFENRIVRPEQLVFTPNDLGDAVIERYEFVGRGYLLTVKTAKGSVLVWHPTIQAIGDRGVVKLTEVSHQA